MKNEKRFRHSEIQHGAGIKMDESDESFLRRIKREEKEMPEIRDELLFKISNNYDIVREMIIYNFVDKFNSKFR
jgi:hypothetical protein